MSYMDKVRLLRVQVSARQWFIVPNQSLLRSYGWGRCLKVLLLMEWNWVMIYPRHKSQQVKMHLWSIGGWSYLTGWWNMHYCDGSHSRLSSPSPVPNEKAYKVRAVLYDVVGWWFLVGCFYSCSVGTKGQSKYPTLDVVFVAILWPGWQKIFITINITIIHLPTTAIIV